MADKILELKLKTGTGAPGNGVLKLAEMAFDTTAKQIYIGTGTGGSDSPIAIQMQGYQLNAKLGTTIDRAVYTTTGGTLIEGTLPITAGGTGQVTFTTGEALVGNGTSGLATRTITNNTSSTIAAQNTNLITQNTLYNASAQINNASQQRSVTIYAPIAGGTAKQTLVSVGSTSAPVWTSVLSTDTVNSRVGINDTNPAEALDITGNINVTGSYKMDDSDVISADKDFFGRNITLSGITGSAYLRGPAELVIDPEGYNDNTGTVKILGNLIVEGVTTTINSTNISTKDKVIELGLVENVTNITGTVGSISGSGETWTATVTGASIDTANLITGMSLTKTAGTGAFGTGAYILSILSSSSFNVRSSSSSTAGSITFTASGTESNLTAAGAGITILDGSAGKKIYWDSYTSRGVANLSAWRLNDNLELASGKTLYADDIALSSGLVLGGDITFNADPRRINILQSGTAGTAGSNLTIQSANAKEPSSSNNVSGGNLLLESGSSVGTSTSEIQFWTPTPAGIASTSLNALAKRVTVSSSGLDVVGSLSSSGNSVSLLGSTNSSFGVSGNSTGILELSLTAANTNATSTASSTINITATKNASSQTTTKINIIADEVNMNNNSLKPEAVPYATSTKRGSIRMDVIGETVYLWSTD
jgi:hypothetical protein